MLESTSTCDILYYHNYLADAQGLSSLAEKNKVSSQKWRQLTEEERQEYNQEALDADCSLVSEKKEIRRMLANLSNLVCNIPVFTCLECVYSVHYYYIIMI